PRCDGWVIKRDNRVQRDRYFYFAAALITLGTAWIVLRLDQADLRQPLSYGKGDNLATEMFVKWLIDAPWIFTNPYIGAPFDTIRPQLLPDNLHLAILKFLGLASHSYGMAINLFYIAT